MAPKPLKDAQGIPITLGRKVRRIDGVPEDRNAISRIVYRVAGFDADGYVGLAKKPDANPTLFVHHSEIHLLKTYREMVDRNAT